MNGETINPSASISPPSELKYRPDIDGLRAVAVLAVVLCHAKLGCAGGFVGVDVFFVISGFLITTIILSEINRTGFKALDFWERRIRRIMPALVVIMTATIAASWFIHLPDDFDRLGQATAAQTVFASNFFHWANSTYFSPEAEALPLLHTWSLALEEQFYVLLPIVLLVLGLWRRAWIPAVLLLALFLSFGLGVWAMHDHQKSAFYLLPPRAWELLLGSVLAAYPSWGGAVPRWLREVVSLAGLAAILMAMACFDSRTRFPGFAALVPCLGAATFLWANRTGSTLGGKFLSWKPLVFVGLVSYSFYLIHWPILVFTKYWISGEISWAWRLGLVAISFLLAVFSWIAVETPIRTRQVLPRRRQLFAATGIALVLLLACGQLIHLNQGFPTRFSPEAMQYVKARSENIRKYQTDLASAKKGDLIRIGAQGPANYLIWGDSHAMCLTPALNALCLENGCRGFVIAHGLAAPLLNFVSRGMFTLGDSAPEFSEAAVKFAIEQQVKTVVMVGYWHRYADESPAFEECLKRTVDRLVAAGLKVVIVRDVPMQQGDVPWRLAKASKFGGDVRTIGVTLADHRNLNRTVDKIFARLGGPNITILDPTPYFENENGLCPAESNGTSLYIDSHHLSMAGSFRTKPLFEPMFRELSLKNTQALLK